MTDALRILLVEDNPGDRDLIRYCMQDPESDATDFLCVGSLGEAVSSAGRNDLDMAILDLSLPDSDGLATFDRLNGAAPNLPVVVLTGVEDEQLGIAALKRGAEDYLIKSEIDPHQLTRAVRFAIERSRRRAADEKLKVAETDLRIAREIQFNQFPHQPPDLPGFDVAGGSFSAESVGGDYYDYLTMHDGSLALIVGDAAGHGLGPSLLMAETRTCLNTLASVMSDLGDIITRANNVLIESMPRNRFVTLLMVRVDPASRTLTYVGAGHPPAFLLGADGKVRTTLKSEGFPLGVLPDLTYCASPPVTMEPGELLLLYSDGVQDATSPSGEHFGDERLLQAAREHRHLPAPAMLDRLYDAVLTFVGTQEVLDDITLLVAKAEAE